jgi:hypothetical protein
MGSPAGRNVRNPKPKTKQFGHSNYGESTGPLTCSNVAGNIARSGALPLMTTLAGERPQDFPSDPLLR